jgi:hypothetical protein
LNTVVGSEPLLLLLLLVPVPVVVWFPSFIAAR